MLLVESPADRLLNAYQTLGLAPVSGSDPDLDRIPDGSLKLAEIVVAPNSKLDGKTLSEIDLRARLGVSVVAIRHEGSTFFSRLAEIPLNFGDSLLVEGSTERLNMLRQDSDFLMIDTNPPLEARRTRKAPLTVAILAGGLVVITLGWLPVSVALLIGAILMVLSGALSMDEAYESIEWKSVFLIAGMLPLGVAMENTGSAQLVADAVIALVGALGPMMVLVGIYIMTGLLTEVISNAAATVVVTPIAIDAALSLGVDPRLRDRGGVGGFYVVLAADRPPGECPCLWAGKLQIFGLYPCGRVVEYHLAAGCRTYSASGLAAVSPITPVSQLSRPDW